MQINYDIKKRKSITSFSISFLYLPVTICVCVYICTYIHMIMPLHTSGHIFLFFYKDKK